MSKSIKRKFFRSVALFLVFVLLVSLAYGFYLYKYDREKFNKLYSYITGDKSSVITVNGELSIHFMMLGNEYSGDCTYIKAGDVDILVDAGSRAGSVATIKEYLDEFVSDGILEYVIVTHADRDHIAGFSASNSLFDEYTCETIIDFPLTNKESTTSSGNASEYGKYVINRDEEIVNGAKHYTALECYNNVGEAKRTYSLTDEISLTFLYQKFYEQSSNDENNYSVCFMLTHGDRNFLFTGDLEKEGEQSLIQENSLPEVELFKAGHHGSPTSSNDLLLTVIKPKIVCMCCCAGSVEFTTNLANTFPSQAFIDRVSKYTDKVYVPIYIDVVYNSEKGKYENAEQYNELNGNISVVSSSDGVIVKGSNNDTKLKDTDWFKNNRTMPTAWKTA